MYQSHCHDSSVVCKRTEPPTLTQATPTSSPLHHTRNHTANEHAGKTIDLVRRQAVDRPSASTSALRDVYSDIGFTTSPVPGRPHRINDKFVNRRNPYFFITLWQASIFMVKKTKTKMCLDQNKVCRNHTYPACTAPHEALRCQVQK